MRRTIASDVFETLPDGSYRHESVLARAAREREADAGLALADDECFCDTPTVARNEHGETWCSVCGERLLLEAPCVCGETETVELHHSDEHSEQSITICAGCGSDE